MKNERKSMLMFIGSMLIFGTIGIFRRYIPLPSGFIAMIRGLLGGLFLSAFVKLKGENSGDRLSLSQFFWLAVTGGVMGFNWILLFEAYNHTTVAVATLCYYMQSTIVLLLSPLLFREKLTKKKMLCAVIAVIGMVLVSGVIGNDGLQSGNLKGVAFGLGAALLYSFVVIMNKTLSGIDAWKKTIIQLISAGAVMIPYLLLSRGFVNITFSRLTVLLLLIVGIVHTGFAYALYFGSMDGLKAQSIALLSYIDPVSALLFSAVFLREPLSPAGLAGAVMIIGSAIMSEL